MIRLLQKLEVRTLAMLAAAAAAVWAFLSVAGEMAEGETASVDRPLMLMLRSPGNPADPIGPRWLEESMRDVTALGGFTFLTLVTVIAASALAFYGKRLQAAVLVGAVVSAELSADLLKALYSRPRPDLVPHLSYVYSHSFPSGHSTLSAATFLTLAGILSSLQTKRRAKAFIFTIAVLLVAAIGFSRVYLGVHWPTDVLAGWTLGAAWALAARLVLGRTAKPETA